MIPSAPVDTNVPIIANDRLRTLLRHAKSEHGGRSWRDVAAALGDLYHPDMSLSDAVHHAAAAFADLLAEPRFQVDRSPSAAEDLLLAPIKGHHAIEALGAPRLDTKYTVEQFYNAQIAYVLGQFSIARIGWCRAWYEGAPPAASASVRYSPEAVQPGAGMAALPAIEEAALSFRTRSGEDLLINPLDQASIDAAKKSAPGEGVGPAVVERLLDLIGRGLIGDMNLLPAEYRHLSALMGTTKAQAEVVLANSNLSIHMQAGA